MDGGQCAKCRRRPEDGAVLQVHHKQYHPGKLPWQYPYEDCKTLCRGCHAGEHGIILPFTGWSIEGYDDLGSLEGECELCGTPIRHVFITSHPKWPTLEVGEICCDHLTSTTDASEHLGSERRQKGRRGRFIRSPRWREVRPGTMALIQRGIGIAVWCKRGGTYCIMVEGIQGKRVFSSEADARGFVFDQLENGEIEGFVRRIRSKRSTGQAGAERSKTASKPFH